VQIEKLLECQRRSGSLSLSLSALSVGEAFKALITRSLRPLRSSCRKTRLTTFACLRACVRADNASFEPEKKSKQIPSGDVEQEEAAGK